MVVPHTIGEIIKSYVRVPNSGLDKGAKPALCDLGRSSTLASTVFVPQNLPPTTNVVMLTQATTPVSVNRVQKRCISEEKGNGNNSSSAPKIIRIQASSVMTPIKTIPIAFTAGVGIPNINVWQLTVENEKLRKENELLKKQISLFKRLIRNPVRLNSVLKLLEERKK